MVEAREGRIKSGHARAPWAAVALTPLEESDLEVVHAWQNDPALRDLTMGFRLPLQREAVRDWLRGLHGPSQHSRALYAIRVAGEPVGIVQIFGIVPFQRRAEIGVFLGSPTLRGAGVGYVAMALMLDFAFNGLDLRKVGAEVLVVNRSVVRLCERIGFVREGLKRQEHFADGACWDTCVLGLLREEFTLRLPLEARRLCASLAPMAMPLQGA